MLRAFVKGTLPLREIRAQLGREPIGVSTPGVPPGLARQLVRYAVIGVASTLAYLVLFSVLRLGMGAQFANVLALGVTAVANTAANRWFTFGVRGATGAGRHQVEGLIVFGIGLALTSGSLALLNSVPGVGRTTEMVVLVLANLAATVVRFLLFRVWVFRKNR
jgi:putative flippase GtrA